MVAQHRKAGGFVISESRISRDNGVLAEGEALEAGTVLMEDAGKLVAHDGSETEAAGILFAYSSASDGDLPVTIIAREAEVNRDLLVYPEDSEENIAAALAATGIEVRPALSGGSGGGGDGYQAAAVHFDNSWLGIESLTASDNSFFSYSVWIKRGVTTDVKIFIGDPAVNYYNENAISAGQWRVEADNAAFDQIISQLSLQSVSPEWVNLLCSVDVNHSSGSKILQMYINNVEVESESPPFETGSGDPFSMVFNGLKFVVGGYTDLTAVFDAADWWIAPGQFIDFSIESNRRKFIDANGKPVDLGSDGSTPTGTAPAMFFSGDASSFATNKGTGGAFTLTGSLTNASTSPSD